MGHRGLNILYIQCKISKPNVLHSRPFILIYDFDLKITSAIKSDFINQGLNRK